MVVNKAKLAQILGISERSLSDWQKEDGFPIHQLPRRRGESQLYETSEVIRWWIARESGDDLNAEKTRLTREQADKTALENARLRAELVPVVLVERSWGKMIGAFRARVLGLPSKLATLLANETEHSGFLRVLRNGVHECLTELSRYELPQNSDGDTEGSDPRADAAPDSQSVGRSVPKAKPRGKRRARPVAH